MRKMLLLPLLTFPFAACDAPTTSSVATPPAARQPATPPAEPDRAALLQDFTKWYAYYYRQIRLARDFAGLDTAGQTLSRREFLTRLASGRYTAFKTAAAGPEPRYQLYPLRDAHANIAGVVRQSAETELRHLRLEGTTLPAYTFTDLQGRRYAPGTTRGKVLVLKCWFIGCFACVQEFPQLNRLVESYQPQSDVLFVSLAFDQPQALRTFLTTHDFKYAVVPEQRAYIQQQLGVDIYPTHILLDRGGRIVRVTNTIEDLQPTLARLAPPTGS